MPHFPPLISLPLSGAKRLKRATRLRLWPHDLSFGNCVYRWSTDHRGLDAAAGAPAISQRQGSWLLGKMCFVARRHVTHLGGPVMYRRRGQPFATALLALLRPARTLPGGQTMPMVQKRPSIPAGKSGGCLLMSARMEPALLVSHIDHLVYVTPELRPGHRGN